MNTTLPSQPIISELQLPDDLRMWLTEDELVQLALQSVANMDLASRESAGAVENRDRPPLPAMLSLLLYAYATSRLGSDEIEHACGEDAVLHYLASRTPPDSEAIRRFRRRHRGLLEAGLTALFAHAYVAWEEDRIERAHPGLLTETSGCHWIAVSAPAHRFVAEAGDRLQRAVFADSVARDV